MKSYGYLLPSAAIAQVPVEPRSAARMLVALADEDVHARYTVSDLPRFLRPGDVVVVNDSRVLPARLRLRRATGGAAEVFLLEPLADGSWEALVRPGRAVAAGTLLYADADADADRGDAVVEVGPSLGEGRRRVRLLAPLAEHGQVPLPPYIHEELPDSERYQTVYARREGSVAAPTAGLHLTDEVLEAVRSAGASIHAVDLAVGLGTFRPITVEHLDEHRMHEERYAVGEETMAACRSARRVVAVGTTTVRALEAAASTGRLTGRTDLFIRPGFRFQVVDVMLTNFHQPRSSLLVMLAAFLGEGWRRLYDIALAEDYRFLSFGDCMLVERAEGGALS